MMIIIAISIIFACIICLINDEIAIAKSPVYGSSVKITWKQLKQFYWINPKKWKYEKVLNNNYSSIKTMQKVLLYDITGRWATDRFGLPHNKACIIRIKLSLFDKIKFFVARHFRKTYKEYHDIEILLKSVQEDINTIKEISSSQIKEANSQIEKIALGLGEK